MRYVTPQGDILRAAPYLGYWGVRPAFYLNTENYTVSTGTGTSTKPYVVSALNAQDYTIDISGAERADVKMCIRDSFGNGSPIFFRFFF